VKGGARCGSKGEGLDGERGDGSGKGDDGHPQPYNETEKGAYGEACP